MTYCLGIVTSEGLVMASDSRSNAGFDQVNVCRKMYRFVSEGERVFVILTSGSLSISQSVISLLRADFDAGLGLAQARRRSITPPGSSATASAASRKSTAPRSSATISASTSTCCSAARSAARPPTLYLIYPQGNPLQATEDSPYLQLGEVKYGRPILDRGIEAGHVARGRRQVRAAVVRRDHAFERDRRPADRLAALQEGHASPSRATGGSRRPIRTST